MHSGLLDFLGFPIKWSDSKETFGVFATIEHGISRPPHSTDLPREPIKLFRLVLSHPLRSCCDFLGRCLSPGTSWGYESYFLGLHEGDGQPKGSIRADVGEGVPEGFPVPSENDRPVVFFREAHTNFVARLKRFGVGLRAAFPAQQLPGTANHTPSWDLPADRQFGILGEVLRDHADDGSVVVVGGREFVKQNAIRAPLLPLLAVIQWHVAGDGLPASKLGRADGVSGLGHLKRQTPLGLQPFALRNR
mmetsp:Transcript_2574/g.5082  ORF Transcript_2574/g.5082 Transcript_2574/m.5082 type:complete len:248 (+) Transcript_2574:1493-2236(+)